MIKFIIAGSVIIAFACIVLLVLYHFGFIDFYHPMNTTTEHQIKVDCVGDSITFGCTVRNWHKNNYPAVLADLHGVKYCVNNFGYTNRTAIKSADYPYTNEKLYQQSLAFEPDFVVIMLGSNDSKENNWNKENFIRDYCQIIESYQKLKSSPKIYILVPTPLFEVGGKVMWQLRKDIITDEVCPAVKQIACQTNIECVDMFTVFENKKELFFGWRSSKQQGQSVICAKDI